MNVQSAMVKVFYILFLIVYDCQVVFTQVGNTCYMRNTGNRGICKISSDCPSVEEQGRKGIDPTVCGYFQLTTPIVCCERRKLQDGEYQSPTKPIFTRPIITSNIFSSEENDSKLNSNNQDNGIVFGETIPFESNPANVNTFQLYPEDSINFGNGDSIIYPNDIAQNNNNVELRKSEAKCLNYTKPFNEVVQAIPLLTETEVVNVNVEKCNNNGVPLIVGGEPAAPGEFPFMAALGFYVDNSIDWRCGGTLISEQFVITAAHCTYSRDAGSPKVVRLGEIDLTKSRRSRFDYNIARIIAHPDYSYPLRYNDIALMKLDRNVKFTDHVRPACLYTSRYIEETQSVATGYGKNEFAASENINKLMKVPLHIYQNEKCAQTFGSDKRSLPRGIVHSMLCAGDVKGGHDTCQGDSGGPLLVTKKSNKCKFFLVGITSFGKSCGEANTAAVYTKVSSYIDWIEDVVWP